MLLHLAVQLINWVLVLALPVLLDPLVGSVPRLFDLSVALVMLACRLLQVKMQFPDQQVPLDSGT